MFRGGLEMLFANKRVHKVTIPALDDFTSKPPTIRYLIKYLCDKVMKDSRKELFVVDDTV